MTTFNESGSGSSELTNEYENTIHQVTNASNGIVERYVSHQDYPGAFDIPGAHVKHDGPSPFAIYSKEDPSVLESYKPKKRNWSLDKDYKYVHVTPLLGTEFRNLQVSDILKDESLQEDLAVLIAERGVVFLRNQKDIDIGKQNALTLALGEKAGNPKTSGLHIHPATLVQAYLNENGKIDPEVLVLNSQNLERLYGKRSAHDWSRKNTLYHSDITFEPVPAGFSILRIIETPSSDGAHEDLREGGGPIGGAGGDTLWANGYALAEKVSPSFLKYLETLEGEYYQPSFKKGTSALDVPLYSAERGAPENIGDTQIAVHPLVRTNPTTGIKSIFAIGQHFNRILGVSQEESDLIKNYLQDLLYQSPELQLRLKWNRGGNDLAIWDNRSAYHSIIPDLGKTPKGIETRTGLRTMNVAERPFLDPESKTLSEALKSR